jgi:CxxC motif-containing protein
LIEQATIVCVVCPVSCAVLVEFEGDGIIKTDHNQCKLALDYVTDELFDPRRTLTTSLPVDGGKAPLVSVKTAQGLPKDDVLSAMQSLSGIHVTAPVHIGDVIVEDVLGTGIHLVATRNVEAA